ncbi:MAG: LysM peptidoglycan-binding domain-containing protein [Elusimicrobia bacterium]|nr:LysM peptidoglycan-binding domain-containing protein [Elusimicrobiota bacterium]
MCPKRLGSLLACAAALWAARALAGQVQTVEMQDLVVKPGQTLWDIANAYLKDSKKWDEILKYNKMPSDPTVALPGMTLRVPVTLIKEDLRAAKLIIKRNAVDLRKRETADWAPARQDMQLYRDDALRTGEDSLARVNFVDQGTLQVDPNSMAIIRPLKKNYDVFLQKGGIWLGKAKVVTISAKITPRTPDTTYTAKVRSDLSTTIEVFKGKATVESQGKKQDVDAGMAAEVKLGNAPSAPFPVINASDFEARGAEFTGDFSGVRSRAGMTTSIATVMALPGEAARAAKIDDINTAVEQLGVGQPIWGFRVQLAHAKDFPKALFDKTYDVQMRIRAADIPLPQGKYWVRFAVIDLLGAQAPFKEGKLYLLGPKSLTPLEANLTGLEVVRPTMNNEITFERKYRVEGKAHEGASVIVNGKRVRLDENNRFSLMVTLVEGDNLIRVTTLDSDGNTDNERRILKYRPP